MAVVLPPTASVDCRIQVVDEGGTRTITIAGGLMAEHVPGLLAACGHAGTLRVNMSDVLSVDAIAADAIRRIEDGGATLVGVSPYIQFKLESIPSKPRSA